ncbi:trafficking protein particle complex protein 2 [Striga asiatica]|uniref:Trafficking protein particle complex protein 2 n=1 Tax=Striga asiatica TaxID=4170 RepID=A0A5A7PFS0_STRAF|nr:trafficking protein particle complex protein 2 [Striga asiatica]
MANTACFMIVSKNDIPIYEAEVGSVPKREDIAHQHQFILHAALDIVQDMAWTTGAMFLKAIDRFDDLVVSIYVTAVLHTRLMLLHGSRNDDGIKSFFQEVHELYIKVSCSHASRTCGNSSQSALRFWKPYYIITFRYKSPRTCQKISVKPALDLKFSRDMREVYLNLIVSRSRLILIFVIFDAFIPFINKRIQHCWNRILLRSSRDPWDLDILGQSDT